MKVLILDCIKEEESAEAKIALAKLLESFAKAGAEVKVVNVNNLDIKPCFSCTAQYSFEYGDKCRCEDDMNSLYPDFRNSDAWVFASHINSNGATKYIKNILDRMEPLFQPDNTIDSSDLSSSQNISNNGKMMLLSSYDYESIQLARQISDYIDSICSLFSKTPAGNILFDKSRNDDNRLNRIYTFGQSFVND